MAKTAAHKIADHLGWDIADVREHRYQPSAFSAPVFAMGGDYYSAGCKPPKYLRGVDDLKWQRIVSAYDGMTPPVACQGHPDRGQALTSYLGRGLIPLPLHTKE